MNVNLKPHTWDNPNKMHIASEYRTFNKQCSLISTGNVFSDCQYSYYIRPYSEVKNFSYTAKPGDFLKYDTKNFSYIPQKMKAVIFDKNRKESVILYEFRTFRNGEKSVFGYVLTDKYYNKISYEVVCGYGQSYYKRLSALYECMNYICNGFYKLSAS